MDNKQSMQLRSDKEFTQLIQPFSNDEYLKFTKSVSLEKPLVFHTWNGVIVDEKGLYEISLKSGIPYVISPLPYCTRENIIESICDVQLQRTDLTVIMRKYLIGKKSAVACTENSLRKSRNESDLTKTDIRKRIGAEYSYGQDSIIEFEHGASVIDTLFNIDPDITQKILSCKTNISFSKLISMSKLSFYHIKEVVFSLSKGNPEIKELTYLINRLKSSSDSKKCVSVKNLPKYDPDSEILSLSLTVPSWVNSIERVHKTITNRISNTAAENLFDRLCELRKTIDQTINTIMEVST